MSKEKKSDSDLVSDLIKGLSPDFAETVAYLRQVILSTDQQISEQVKWNSPAFYYNGEMKSFDAKEYKRDLAVINVRKENVLIVFPTGAKIADTTGILEGNYTDGRRLASFTDLENAKKKSEDLQKVIRQWLSLVEK